MRTLSCTLKGSFEVRFQSLFNEGRALAFPCDHAGQVDLDALPDRARDNYLYARALVGREYSVPHVQVASPMDVQATAA